MDDEQFRELAHRIDGIAWSLTTLICMLEINQEIDGPALCRALRSSGALREKHPGRETAGRVMQEIADRLDSARQCRSEAH